VKLTPGSVAAQGSSVSVPVSCLPSGGNCRGTLQLGPKAGSSAYGSAKVNLEAGSAGGVKVKLSKKAAKTLAKKGKLKVVASIGGTQVKLKLTGKKKG
jgi:hypothetical protein